MSAGSRFDRTADRYAAMAAGRDWSGLVGWCEPASGDRALDVAGGPGALAAALLSRVGSITVLDTSSRLLEFVPDGIGRALGAALATRVLDTRKLHNGIYTVVATAADIAGNTTTRRLTFLVYNRDRWPPRTNQA